MIDSFLSEEAVLGFSGELRQKKGFPFLMSALTAVRQQRPACLLVIGEVRPRERALLSSFAAEFPEDAERIVITGRLDDPADVAMHLRLCDVFLQPSLWDGLPNAVLEAMACGLVSIGSDAGGIPEVIQHEQNGFTIPRAQLNRLGDGILDVLQLSDDERTTIGQAARKRIEDAYHPGAEASALERVLNRLRSKKSS